MGSWAQASALEAPRDRAVDDARDALLAAAAGVRERTRLVVRIPDVSMTAVLAAARGDAAAWLAPRDVQQTRGSDARIALAFSKRAEGSGERRFDELRTAWSALQLPSRALGAAAERDLPPARAWVVGTFDDARYDEVWSGFPSSALALPAVEVIRDAGFTSLSIVAEPGDARLSERIVSATEIVRDALPVATPQPLAPTPHATSVGGTLESEYRAMVDRIVAGIRAGDFAKVVAARRVDVRFDGPVHAESVLRSLAFGYPRCVRFAWRWRGDDRAVRTFVGATPERLLRVSGRTLETEALAGTVEAANGAAAEALLASAKDRGEHELVVDYLRDALHDVCDTLDIDAEPSVRRLRNVLHLRTGVRGVLREGIDAFALLQRLHPTPAVGGLPALPARAWIREHEATPRGAYAAPIGWIDEQGDAEFAVAIRSAVLRDRQAHLYAGAGIVRDSDAAMEYRETAIKLRAMGEALGLSLEQLATSLPSAPTGAMHGARSSGALLPGVERPRESSPADA